MFIQGKQHVSAPIKLEQGWRCCWWRWFGERGGLWEGGGAAGIFWSMGAVVKVSMCINSRGNRY